ncbi:hypothetical protein Sta7437_2926 [Stanieria cyanosphaera PCC 7437]|uniref:PhoD-like phosphatase n=1 Tax=Stanieria cyanosphaera (strain ATCC 29371 / PCC 7437) TaxID=111780 RepID=K9XV20_STAC7|nr:hypothetical protein [Stanieria cyanosphaera]AFZ36445.1 hypothetical protein Sta7437_2926 [Stanieria cyanosphaera PCC 7437]
MRQTLDFLTNINDLPLILAGPILRRTETDGIAVWLALKQASKVTLKIYATAAGRGQSLERELGEGEGQTIQLGQYLHLLVVTVKLKQNNRLKPGQVYAYDLYFDGQINLATALDNTKISYFDHQLPTFSLPSADLNQLKVIHGSCRKPHGGGRDILSCLDVLIETSADLADERPQQLFLTGDQIYGDDVADPFLWLTQKVSNFLLGWEENLPLLEGVIKPSELPPGKRSEIARLEGGFTAMLQKQPEKAKSHLFSFGEYATAYLLAWSPVLMRSQFPAGREIFTDSKLAKNWDQELLSLTSFIEDLPKVRRALANIPTYTICDDHDISDDWYLNRLWCDRVLSKPLGRRVVQNGLLAYALFQAWGNTPEQFQPGTSGEKLLQAAMKWCSSAGTDSISSVAIIRYLGLPPVELHTGLPQLQPDQDVLILARDKEALTWHYSIKGSKHEVFVLDTRTWRGYPRTDRQGKQPPMLLSHTAFEQQLINPLASSDTGQIEATLIVLPTNLVTLGLIDQVQRWELKRNRVFSNDVGDSWNFHQTAFAKLLLSLAQSRDRIIILSGDIHYSCAIRLTHWFYDPASTAVLVQLTSSAIKNSELSTRIVQTRIKNLFPEPTENWLGWQKSLRLLKLPQNHWWQSLGFGQKPPQLSSSSSPPDWQYQLEWCYRKPIRPLFKRSSKSLANHKSSFWQNLFKSLLFWLWRNPWLQEGSEVVGRNNISLVRFQWSSEDEHKTVIQETYWHPPWNNHEIVKSNYVISLKPQSPPTLPGLRNS